MRTSLELTARGRLCVILLHLTAGAAWLTGENSARLAASMLAAPLLVDLFHKLWRAPKLEVSIRPRRTASRTTFLEPIVLRNLAPRSAAHDLLIAEQRTQTVAGSSWVDTLPATATSTVQLSARSRRRGIFPSREISIESHYPLGMLRWRAEVSLPTRMIVEPSRIQVPAEYLRAFHSDDSPANNSRHTEAEFYALREYRTGDDARMVHPLRSASLGGLVSKVFRGSEAPECTVVLDLRRPPGSTPSLRGQRFEDQLSVAISLVETTSQQGSIVRCLVLHSKVEQFIVRSQVDLEKLGTFLASARAVPFRTHQDPVLDELPKVARCFWIAAGDYIDRVHAPPNGRILAPDSVTTRGRAS